MLSSLRLGEIINSQVFFNEILQRIAINFLNFRHATCKPCNSVALVVGVAERVERKLGLNSGTTSRTFSVIAHYL